MIKFHKIKNRPVKLDKGEEAISFTYTGEIYVTDNDGNPVLMTAGTQSGDKVPTWTPLEPNALYYDKKNKKHYISDTEKWFEIPRKSTGSEGGPTTMAGNVIVADNGDNFTSADVEGALAEIVDKIPGFKNGIIENYDGDAKDITGTHEYFLTQNSTNRPSGELGWVISRKGANGSTYGYYADKNNAYHYVDGVYSRLAKKSELDLALKTIKDDFGQDLEKLKKKTILVKNGLESNGKGYFDGLEIGLSKEITDKLDNIGELGNGHFVKLGGDSMAGNLVINTEIKKSNDSLVTLQDGSGRNGVSFYYNRTTENVGIFDARNNQAILRHNLSNGDTGLYSEKRNVGLFAPKGQINTLSSDRVLLETKNANTILRLQNKSGGFLLGATGDTTYLETYPGTNVKTGKNLMIRGASAKTLRQVTSLASFTYARHSLVAGSSLHVGMDPLTEYGHTGYNDMINSLVCIHPYERNNEWGANRNYARLGYSQRNNVLRVQSYRKNTGVRNYVDRTNQIGVEASFFRNTSSIEFKDILEKMDTKLAFEDVMKTEPFLYTFKNDHSETKEVHAGFIIEEGMPKETVAPDGKTVDSYGLIAYMYGAFQEYVTKTDKKIQNLEAQLATR